MIDHDPSRFEKQVAHQNREIAKSQALKVPVQILKFFFLAICILVGLVELVVGFTFLIQKHESDSTEAVLGFFGCAALFIVSFMLFLKFQKSNKQHNAVIQNCQLAIYSLERDSLMDTKVGDYIICPHCENPSDYFPQGSLPPVEGLKHCLNCGKQFFTSGLNSYQVIFKS